MESSQSIRGCLARFPTVVPNGTFPVHIIVVFALDYLMSHNSFDGVLAFGFVLQGFSEAMSQNKAGLGEILTIGSSFHPGRNYSLTLFVSILRIRKGYGCLWPVPSDGVGGTNLQL